jgi:hypothetical protein
MQPHANTETNRTPEVEPAIKHTVPWRVTSVTALPDARFARCTCRRHCSIADPVCIADYFRLRSFSSPAERFGQTRTSMTTVIT